MKNRRNYYRLLHVQPEAPLEVIKASYRSLMTKLKGHPDLGGDHDAAVLINEAYEVLKDPARRRQYDDTFSGRKRAAPAHHQGEPSSGPSRRPARSPTAGNSNAGRAGHRPAPLAQCPFCGTAGSTSHRCRHCSSPLSPASALSSTLKEALERRIMPRIVKTAALLLYPSWPHAGHPASLRDLSPTGVSLFTGYEARREQILKIDSSLLQGIARVVSVQSREAAFSVHASFLTIEFTTDTGGLVSERA